MVTCRTWCNWLSITFSDFCCEASFATDGCMYKLLTGELFTWLTSVFFIDFVAEEDEKAEVVGSSNLFAINLFIKSILKWIKKNNK